MMRAVTAAAAACVLAAAGPAAGVGKAAKPDILFVAIDDLNDWTGCLGGHPQASTPNLDRLAARGTLFANAQCAAPACNPSRAALMSGLRPFTTGVYENGQPYGKPLKDALTLNRYLKREGYLVLGGGKIYHGGGGLPDEHRTDWDGYYDRTADPHPPVKARHSGTDGSAVEGDWRGRFADAYRCQLRDFVAALTGGPFLGASAWDGYVASVTADACVKAMRSGEVVPISIAERPAFYNR